MVVGWQRWNIRSRRRRPPPGHLDLTPFRYQDLLWVELKHIEDETGEDQEISSLERVELLVR